ncbi:MAG TPA: fused MFS/spermidine synthase [Gaiellaceae bacterium]|nr:fused MFS/spermidine synthase [Gaiellaceae bacterium]
MTASQTSASADRFQAALTGVVFAAGVGSLATEIAASRLLAPYFGNSTIVWANVIGLILASLSLGYWLGGRLADRRPSPRALGTVVVAAACLIAVIPFVARPLLDLSVEGLDRVSAGAAIGSFFGVLILFVPPVVLLGMVAPFAIRLALTDVRTAGAVAGRLYAVSTVGSLLGTFLSALVLIPAIGTQRTLLAAAALIGGGGALLLGRRWLVLAGGLAALLLIPPGAVKAQAGLLYEDESRYQFIQVVEQDGVRRLYLDEGLATHSVWRRDTVLTGGVWDTYLAVPDLLGRPPERVAMLGNAAGTAARAFARFYPFVRIDGVELDPAVSDAGRRFFEMGTIPGLEVHDLDARSYLRQTDERYDVIIVDAYRPPYVPFYLATKEFFELVRTRLNPGGIVALNVATTPDDHSLATSVAGTLASVLPRVLAWQPLRFNQIVIGQNGAPLGSVRPAPAAVKPLVDDLRRSARSVAAAADPWTDDRAPVEWITDRMIVEFAAEGGRFEEEPLPTLP